MAPILRDAMSFAQHYYDYIRSPAVVVIFFILVGPLVYRILQKLRENLPRPRTKRKFDCFRLGISQRSNLEDQYQQSPRKDGNPKIKALFTYPVKSCRGVELAASEVGPTGLKYDRLFTFAQLVSKPEKVEHLKEGEASQFSDEWKHEWQFITQREFPRLALLDVELWVPDPRRQKPDLAKNRSKEGTRDARGRKIVADEGVQETDQSSWASNGGCLFVRFPYEPDFNPFGFRTEYITLRLPLAPRSKWAQTKQYTLEKISIWKDRASAINVTNEIAPNELAKLKHFLGISNPLALFRVDDRNHRAVTRSLPKDRPDERYTVGFGDAFPLHIINIASVQALNDDLPDKAKIKGKMDARRFRANIYLTDAPAYEEDTWKKILAGRCIKAAPSGDKVVETDGEYHVACRTARCTLPNVDQKTGIRDANEPYTTLGKTRKVDKGAYPHPCLGMQMIPLFAQGLLKVGDEVGVVETGEHVYEKMFASE